MSFQEKIKISYFYSFVFQSVFMFIIKISIAKFTTEEINYLQAVLESAFFGLIMSWAFVTAIKRAEKENKKLEE